MDEGVRIRLAGPADAFAVAALHIQDERERGHRCPSGFLDAFADAWLADTGSDRRVTFLADEPTGRPVGVITAAVVPQLPRSTRTTRCWLHVSNLFVIREARNHGLGESLLRDLIRWGQTRGAARIHLNADHLARPLYERVGFGAASDRAMTLDLGPS